MLTYFLHPTECLFTTGAAATLSWKYWKSSWSLFKNPVECQPTNIYLQTYSKFYVWKWWPQFAICTKNRSLFLRKYFASTLHRISPCSWQTYIAIKHNTMLRTNTPSAFWIGNIFTCNFSLFIGDIVLIRSFIFELLIFVSGKHFRKILWHRFYRFCTDLKLKPPKFNQGTFVPLP